ncbi:FG-GAP repeat domain-containing protein [Streptomonospora sediminis]
MCLLTACGGGSAADPAAPGPDHPAPTGEPDVDFNGDGYADYAVEGWQGASYTSEPYVGALLGGPGGLKPGRSVVRTQQGLQIPPDKTSGGNRLTTGGTADFDGDGFTDMLVWSKTGYLVWGGPNGLAKKAVALPWDADGSTKDGIGADRAVGDFDGDGAVDIALLGFRLDTDPQRYEASFVRGPFDRSGAPSAIEELPLPLDAEDGLTADRIDAFDANGDDAMDLMILRQYDESPAPHIVLASDGDGPAAERLADTPPGHEAESGDFDGDGATDLLIGAHGIPNNENLEGADDPELHPGYVDVYPGAAGFATGEPARITRATPGVAGKAKDADGFGETVLTADVQGDGYDDAVVDPGPAGDRWSATLLGGSPEGLTRATTVELAAPEAGDSADFSWEPGELRDYDGDGTADLLLFEPYADEGGPDSYSAFAVYRGTENGFATKPNRFTTKGF